MNSKKIKSLIIKKKKSLGWWDFPNTQKIEINGDGSHVRCFLSVQDFAEAIFLLVKKKKTGIFNIGNFYRLFGEFILDIKLKLGFKTYY